MGGNHTNDIVMRPTCAPTPDIPATPQYRRIQQLRQLRLIRRNRFKKRSKNSASRPATEPTTQPTPTATHTAPKNTSPNHITTTSPFNTAISPILIHPTPCIDSPHTPNSSILTNSNSYNSLNDTYLNDTPSIIFDHSNFLNETQSPKHLQYISGTYIYTSH